MATYVEIEVREDVNIEEYLEQIPDHVLIKELDRRRTGASYDSDSLSTIIKRVYDKFSPNPDAPQEIRDLCYIGIGRCF